MSRQNLEKRMDLSEARLDRLTANVEKLTEIVETLLTATTVLKKTVEKGFEETQRKLDALMKTVEYTSGKLKKHEEGHR